MDGMPKYMRVWLMIHRDGFSVGEVARILYPDRPYYISKRIVLRLERYAEERIFGMNSDRNSTTNPSLQVFYNPSHYAPHLMNSVSAERPLVAVVHRRWGRRVIVLREADITDVKRGHKRNLYEMANLARYIYDEIFPPNYPRTLWDMIVGLIHAYGSTVKSKVWVARRRGRLYVKLPPDAAAFLYIVFLTAYRKVLRHEGPKQATLKAILKRINGGEGEFYDSLKTLSSKLYFLLM